MSLGVTWWHGYVGNPNAEASGPIPRRDAEKELREWEATMAWEGKKHSLNREASELLKANGHKVKWDGFLSVDEPVSSPSLSDEEFMALIAALIVAGG